MNFTQKILKKHSLCEYNLFISSCVVNGAGFITFINPFNYPEAKFNVLVILALRKFSITNTDTDTTTTDTTDTTTTDTTTDTTSMETSYNNAGAMKAQILEETRGKRGIYRWINNSTGDTYIGSAENLGV